MHPPPRTEARLGGDLCEWGGTGRWREEEQSHRVGCTPGPSRENRGSRSGGRGNSGGLNAEHEEGAPRSSLPPRGHAPASTHWSAGEGGRGCFGPVSGRQRTANGRCSTASRAGLCGCAVQALAYSGPGALSRSRRSQRPTWSRRERRKEDLLEYTPPGSHLRLSSLHFPPPPQFERGLP